ncbi:hypothetical protein B0H17DRAFT_1123611 [Mycena rosella]|uniref:Uncharacterized protein n=1 Tax=Mycena rosella TaxID=1033263 RepID=A0AAD7MCU1_MYCRO|nr:hypothetical protein B0H17DRAFT_1123611 [Mycena rosella]
MPKGVKHCVEFNDLRPLAHVAPQDPVAALRSPAGTAFKFVDTHSIWAGFWVFYLAEIAVIAAQHVAPNSSYFRSNPAPRNVRPLETNVLRRSWEYCPRPLRESLGKDFLASLGVDGIHQGGRILNGILQASCRMQKFTLRTEAKEVDPVARGVRLPSFLGFASTFDAEAPGSTPGWVMKGVLVVFLPCQLSANYSAPGRQGRHSRQLLLQEHSQGRETL